MVPLCFRVFSNGTGGREQGKAMPEQRSAQEPSVSDGVRWGNRERFGARNVFRSRQSLRMGDPLEMYLTMPRELTGRESEKVR